METVESGNYVILRANERRVLAGLEALGDRATVTNISARVNLEVSGVSSIAQSLRSKGLITIRGEKHVIISLTQEGIRYCKLGLPERRLLYLVKNEQPVSIPNLKGKAMETLTENEFQIGLSWLIKKGWASIDEAKRISLTKGGEFALTEKGSDEKLIELLGINEEIDLERLPTEFKSASVILVRRNLIIQKEETMQILKLTDLGTRVLKGEVKVIEEVTKLTSEHIARGTWKLIKLKEYDIKAFSTYRISG